MRLNGSFLIFTKAHPNEICLYVCSVLFGKGAVAMLTRPCLVLCHVLTLVMF